jgi:organic radical activating enzyme
VAKSIYLYKTFEELPLVNTGCDSYASWHPAFKDLSHTLTHDELISKMLALTPNKQWEQHNGNDVHLVITGGEPLLGWQRGYEELLSQDAMSDLKNITFETNGTQTLQLKFKDFLHKWRQPDIGAIPTREITFSVSPKLSASGELWSEAIRPEIIADYQSNGTVYLKFVVDSEAHFEEVDRAVAAYREAGFRGITYVMPQGGVVTPYECNRVNVANWALERGYNYSPRLHVDLWGNGWGK